MDMSFIFTHECIPIIINDTNKSTSLDELCLENNCILFVDFLPEIGSADEYYESKKEMKEAYQNDQFWGLQNSNSCELSRSIFLSCLRCLNLFFLN